MMNKGDKVMFIPPNFIVYDKEGEEMYTQFKTGIHYTAKDVHTLCIKLEEVEGMFLKEHFRVVEFPYEFICKDCGEDFASKDPKSNCAQCSSPNVKIMDKTKIKAEIVADSLSPQGDRLTSLLVTFPRIILAEVNTHRMLSKNTSSSRAIPFKKMVESVQNDPFIPIAWQKHHSGMQGIEYFTDEKDIYRVEQVWGDARRRAIDVAKDLHSSKVTKQLCNRLLEPFMWTTMLITGSKEGWDNFFNLRAGNYGFTIDGNYHQFKSKKELLGSRFGYLYKDNTDLQWLQINKGQAEIHMMALAESIYDAMSESTPEQLAGGMWHIPFMSSIDSSKLQSTKGKDVSMEMVKISTAMAAHTSYTIVGGEAVKSYEKCIELHDKLVASDPPHSSPMEHCARAMSNEEYVSFIKGNLDAEIDADGYIDISTHINNHNSFGWCRNFKGFIPYRHIIETK